MNARSAAVLAALLSAVIFTAGCGGPGTDSSSSPAAGGGAAEQSDRAAPSDPDGRSAGSDPSSPGTAGQPARAVPATKAEVKTATMTVRVANVARAAQRAEDLALTSQGTVAAVQTTVDPEDARNTSAHLTLRVPNDEFTAFLRSLAALGTRLEENQSTTDVTSQVVDVESRLASQRASVARVRVLLAQADDIEDVVRVEAELARREADLESLEAQQKALADKTAQATVSVTFVGEAGTPKADEDDLGFLVGLSNGWHALADAVVVGLTVLGALLPFLVLAAVITVPGLLIWRSRRRGVTTAVPDAGAPAIRT